MPIHLNVRWILVAGAVLVVLIVAFRELQEEDLLPKVPGFNLVHYGNSKWAGKYVFTDNQWFEGSIELFDDGTFKESYSGCMGWWGTEGNWRSDGDMLFLEIISGRDRWEMARTEFRFVTHLGDEYLLPADWDKLANPLSPKTERGYYKLGL